MSDVVLKKEEESQVELVELEDVRKLALPEGEHVVSLVGIPYKIEVSKDGSITIADTVLNRWAREELLKDFNKLLKWCETRMERLTEEDRKMFSNYLYKKANAFKGNVRDQYYQEIKDVFEPYRAKKLVKELTSKGVVPEEFTSDIEPYYQLPGVLTHPDSERSGVSADLSGVTFKQPPYSKDTERLKHLYENVEMPQEEAEQVKEFLMGQDERAFSMLIPYKIKHAKREQMDADFPKFEAMMMRLLDSIGGFIRITQGVFGLTGYGVDKTNLAQLYSDELGLKEIYATYSRTHVEVKLFFQVKYSWTKDWDEELDRRERSQKRREKMMDSLYHEEQEEKKVWKKMLVKKDEIEQSEQAKKGEL